MLTTLIVFVFILGLLIFVHEMGHFIAARKFGVKVDEFGMGLPPRMFGFYKDKNGKWKKVIGSKEVKDVPKTIYSMNWLPLGGFCNIKGEDGGGKNERDSFASKKIWQRASILTAGVAMNFLLCAILLSVGFMIGLPQAITDAEDKSLYIRGRQIVISEVADNSPAKNAGIQMGDYLTSIDGMKFENVEEARDFIAGREGQELAIILTRGDEEIFKKIVPQKTEEIKDRAIIGVGLVKTGIISYPLHKAVYMGFASTVKLAKLILVTFFELFRDFIFGRDVKVDVAGPIGIAVLTGQVVKMGFIYILQFTALISLNLAIINFLPIPALDGGRMVFLLIEKIRGSAISQKIENRINTIGFACLMLLFVVITFHDISRFRYIFVNLWGKITGLF
ncbi:RIP metalloprotease RseP [Candidatus Parcubacteria bacterium]|nr:RIP metalloprotease RseP [Candidatus Parcubacteria bacterium]